MKTSDENKYAAVLIPVFLSQFFILRLSVLGLSMLVYDKRDGGVKVRRIENKLGIKGSPTCELV